jgi:hypothetical protein
LHRFAQHISWHDVIEGRAAQWTVAENPGNAFLADMLGMWQDAIAAREDHAPWVKLANDPNVPVFMVGVTGFEPATSTSQT